MGWGGVSSQIFLIPHLVIMVSIWRSFKPPTILQYMTSFNGAGIEDRWLISSSLNSSRSYITVSCWCNGATPFVHNEHHRVLQIKWLYHLEYLRYPDILFSVILEIPVNISKLFIFRFMLCWKIFLEYWMSKEYNLKGLWKVQNQRQIHTMTRIILRLGAFARKHKQHGLNQ